MADGGLARIGTLKGKLSGVDTLKGRLTGVSSLKGKLTLGQVQTVEQYAGPYIIDPTFERQLLNTNNKLLTDDVTVNEICVSRVTNPSGGITVYIGGI